MRRFLGMLLNALTVLSFVLCVATVALWVRSAVRIDFAETAWARTGLRVWSTSGVVAVHVFDRAEGGGGSEPWFLTSESHGGGYFLEVNWARLGFGWDNLTPPTRNRLVSVPYWAIAVAASLLPFGRVMTASRFGRSTPGLCPACGYDLRATPDRCPECGRVRLGATRDTGAAVTSGRPAAARRS